MRDTSGCDETWTDGGGSDQPRARARGSGARSAVAGDLVELGGTARFRPRAGDDGEPRRSRRAVPMVAGAGPTSQYGARAQRRAERARSDDTVGRFDVGPAATAGRGLEDGPHGAARASAHPTDNGPDGTGRACPRPLDDGPDGTARAYPRPPHNGPDDPSPESALGPAGAGNGCRAAAPHRPGSGSRAAPALRRPGNRSRAIRSIRPLPLARRCRHPDSPPLPRLAAEIRRRNRAAILARGLGAMPFERDHSRDDDHAPVRRRRERLLGEPLAA
jgi:hypothetical protein